jgi:nucleotidyltransferase substrate binding protein (TIGR01987 family)
MATDKLDLDSLHKALASFDASTALVHDADWLSSQSAVVRDTVIAGAIQNFEFAYELSVKMLKRQLERDAATPTEIDESSFRDLLRIAGEKGLIGDVAAWFGYRQMRNLTAHTYDQAKARQVLENLPAFARDAHALAKALAARNA